MFRIIILSWMLLSASLAREFVPKLHAGTRDPYCADGRSYCQIIEDYPRDLIEKLVKSAPPEITSFLTDSTRSTSDVRKHSSHKEFPVNLPANTSAVMKNKNEQLCDTVNRAIWPQAARDDQYEWRYIVNIPLTEQMLEIEYCKTENINCSARITQSLALCKEKMMSVKLLALHPSGGKLVFHKATIPSCCQCILYDVHSDFQ